MTKHIFARRLLREGARRGLLALACLGLLTLPLDAGSVPVGKAEDVGMSPERVARIREIVQRHIDEGGAAGLVTLVARRGQIVHFEAQGYRDLEARTPMPKNAIFWLASMSKPITGVAVLMLYEEGKLRLSDPVSRFIPEFAGSKVAVPRPGGGRGRGAGPGDDDGIDVVSAEREITIHDLLTHTSGLVSGGLGAAQAGRIAPQGPNDTLATHIPKLGAVPLDFQPGTLWRYSGQAGFNVLSRIVEIVSGQTYLEFLRERLLGPLGMHDTGFAPTAEQASRIALMYQRTPGGLVRNPDQRAGSAVYYSGAGGMMSTAEDYLQFAQMLLNGGELDGRRYLSPRTVALMTSNHTGDMVNGQFGRPPRGMGFGLSVQVVLDPVASGLRVGSGAHGWAGGTGVSYWVDPEEEVVSLFMIQGGNGALRGDFEAAIMQAIVD